MAEGDRLKEEQLKKLSLELEDKVPHFSLSYLLSFDLID
jgi:hypothetical protein